MYKYLLYFLIFSFLGWCAEVVFQFFKSGRFVNRGLARGPFCPIYGVGICLSYALLGGVGSFVLLALLSMAIATAVELAVGYMTDRALSLRLWDYTGEKGNILGYVCPRFSLIWGIVCATVIKFLRFFDPFSEVLDAPIFKGIAFTLFVLVLTDERISMLRSNKRTLITK
jgi:uncharacterized membrane protein